MRKSIPLRDRTGATVAHALVDAEDYARFGHLRWHLNPDGYVQRSEHVGGRRRLLKLHRAVMGIDYGDPRRVDHENHNPLDNQRSNLRVVTHAENIQNRAGANRGARSAHRGVSYCKQTGRWKATVVIDRVQHWLGRFDTEEEADRAAAAFRAQHMPFSSDARVLERTQSNTEVLAA